MRRVCYSCAMSLDGFIADPSGGVTRRQGGYDMPGVKAYVFSRTLKQADVPNATVSDDPGKTVNALKQATGKDIWLFGGGELFRSLLERRLVDEVEIAVLPILLGAGLPMLPPPAPRARLALTKQKLFKKTGTLLLNYDVQYSKGHGARRTRR